MKLILRYFDTLRHLRFIQWIGRVKQFLPKRIPNSKNLPEKRIFDQSWKGFEWRKNSIFKNKKVKFLNFEKQISKKEDWIDTSSKLIWLFNLHYFDGINSKGNNNRKDLNREWINLWIDENPPCFGVGWNPYCTSLRIVNWIKWSLKNNILSEKETKSLVIQIRWLTRNLEIQFLGNHYWSNAKALCFAGAFFEGVEANNWQKLGIKIINKQLDEQCLDDGGHFERSPMYHSIFLEDVLDLIHLSELIPEIFSLNLKNKLIHKAEIMMKWMYSMCHPDKNIAFFNDATFYVAPNFNDLLNYSKNLKRFEKNYRFSNLSTFLKESGFIRLVSKDLVCLCDVGSINPGYNPGHSHAETLSFEMSFKKNRMIVNSGISVYGRSDLIIKQRSTLSHSTLCLDNENSSDVWSGFRVGRRARVDNCNFYSYKNNEIAFASHDGYRFLDGSPIHTRMWRIEKSKLSVYDHINSLKKHRIDINFIFHPKWELEKIFNSIIIKDKKNNNIVGLIEIEKDFIAKIEKSYWNKGFGISISNNVLHLIGKNNSCTTKTTFSFEKLKIRKFLEISL